MMRSTSSRSRLSWEDSSTSGGKAKGATSRASRVFAWECARCAKPPALPPEAAPKMHIEEGGRRPRRSSFSVSVGDV